MLVTMFLIIIGFASLIFGANWLVDGASSLAKKNNVSDLVIGLTIVAFGTSAPELVVNTVASFNGLSDIVFGNIIGSNIYNVLMIMGVGASLGGILITSDVYVDYAIMIIFGISLLVGFKTRIINRTMGVILTAGPGQACW